MQRAILQTRNVHVRTLPVERVKCLPGHPNVRVVFGLQKVNPESPKEILKGGDEVGVGITNLVREIRFLTQIPEATGFH